MEAASILLVEDEKLIRLSLVDRLEREGYEVTEVDTGKRARQTFSEYAFDLVLLDQRLPDADGHALLDEFLADEPDLPVILMTAYSKVADAVKAMQRGAFDYLTKPFNMDELLLVVGKALETTRLKREIRRLRADQKSRSGFSEVVGKSEAMVEVFELVDKLVESGTTTILIQGESGTGKDLLARTIHYNSDRAERPLVTVTCPAIPEKLLESELFGHEKGAFTDARQQKKGLFELADGGTIFLDEIGEMPPALQSKLLRFLEEKTFKRVGGLKDITVDVRIIAATNRVLEKAVEAGEFREDLYYRLKVLPIDLPPLRERPGDVEYLVMHYLDVYNQEFKKRVEGIAPEAMVLLQRYHWPGNIRELKNVIERALILRSEDEITPDDLPLEIRKSALGGRPLEPGTFRLPPGGIVFTDLEKDIVRQALEHTGGNQTEAARLLGMTRDQIRYRVEKFGLM